MSGCSWCSTGSSTRSWRTTCAASSPTRIVNQVGFMVTGIGIGTEMALNGAAAHAFAHIIYKALLLMSAGSVLYMTGQAQMHRSRRTVPHHAADHDLRHRRRAVDLVVPAHVRLRVEVDDLRGRRHAAPGSRLVPAGGGLGRAFSCTPASSSRGSYSSRRIQGLRPPDPPLEHAAGDDFFCRLFASAWACGHSRCTPCCRSRWTSCPTRRAMSCSICNCCCSPVSPSS